MSSDKSLLELYEIALKENNKDEVERIQSILLSGYVNEGYDREFIDNIKSKRVYENLLKTMYDGLDYDETVKFLSSMITHYVIESSRTKREYSDYPINSIYVLLGDMLHHKEGAMKDVKEFVITKYSRYI